MRQIKSGLFCLVLLVVSSIQADGWSTTRRCLKQPSLPPAEWSFSGTILTNGIYGIHGFQAGWETTRVLAFTHIPGKNSFSRNSLSPDGRWYVSLEGSSFCTTDTCMGAFDTIERLHIFDLLSGEPRRYKTIDWYFTDARDTTGSDATRIVWRDSTHFHYYSFEYEEDYPNLTAVEKEWIVDVTTGERTEWQSPDGFESDPDAPFLTAPDLTRRIQYSDSDGNYALRLFDMASRKPIYQFVEADNTLPQRHTTWSPNSQHFLMQKQTAPDENQLLLYNRLGEVVTVLARMPFPDIWADGYGYSDISWSRSGDHLAVRLKGMPYQNHPTDWVLYLVDLNQQHITETCAVFLSGYSSWSPDAEHIAFAYEQWITVMDRAGTYWYKLARLNEGWYGIIGWQS